MTQKTDLIEQVERIIVVIDICSSTKLLETLTHDNFGVWRNFLIDAKNKLTSLGVLDHENYKFIGDGWILLFDPLLVQISTIIERIVDFSKWFDEHLNKDIIPHLENKTPSIMGLTFGLHRGYLTSFNMITTDEYVGRAINIACRLQGATKEEDEQPQYKMTLSSGEFTKQLDQLSKFSRVETHISLRNINDGTPYPVVKLDLFDLSGKHVKHVPSKAVEAQILSVEPTLFKPTTIHINLLLTLSKENRLNFNGVCFHLNQHNRHVVRKALDELIEAKMAAFDGVYYRFTRTGRDYLITDGHLK